MGRNWSIAFALFSLPLFSMAGDGDYAVSKIPPLLLKNANIIIRDDFRSFEVSSLTKARLYEKKVITVVNELGDAYANLYEYYDKLRSIRSIDGKLYDANGKQVRSLKNKEIRDESAVSEISLMEDTRVKIHSFFCRFYPYTVEYEVVTEFNNTFLFPGWFPQHVERCSVEKSSMSVTCPSWFTFRYKAFNYEGGPVVTDSKDKRSYTWAVKNLPAITPEFGSPDLYSLTTCVFFSPDKFELQGYQGSMATWNELGKFQLQLNKGRDNLPADVKQKVHGLTDQVSDAKEKVRLLYEYLQKNTRYVSIQLGIGGLQPFDAAYVAARSYGDCKALTNYMQSLLKEAGIRSCFTEIRSGRGRSFFMPDFPSDQFDHVILCVPLQHDTVWLECTSQTYPAGYLGGFTCNRYALAIDENGGQLVHTPAYGMEENLQLRKVKAVLASDGTLKLKADTRYTGMQQDNIQGVVNELSNDRLKEYLHEELDFATCDINGFDYKENKTALPSIDESLDITVSNYATITGKRIFMLPNLMSRMQTRLTSDPGRKYDLVLGFEYKDADSMEIELPDGYLPEAMPQDVKVETRFGRYSCSVRLNGNRLFYYRSLEHYSGRFPAGDYDKLVEFYETIYRSDRNRVVLIKNE